MSRPNAIGRLTHPEYLALETKSDIRHEFLNGEVYEMAGGTPDHGAVAAAVIRDLGSALRGRPFRVFSSDVRVRIRATGLTTYPDASVVCGELQTDPEDQDAIANPLLVVEVLSPSTEAYDRGAKSAHYRQIPSLRELMLVSPTEPRVEVLRRSDGGVWELREARPGERLELLALGVTLEVAAIFENPLPAGPA
jgi:Uma2 family endonuclease